MAEVEAAVVELATKAKNNKLTIEEMTGALLRLPMEVFWFHAEHAHHQYTTECDPGHTTL